MHLLQALLLLLFGISSFVQPVLGQTPPPPPPATADPLVGTFKVTWEGEPPIEGAVTRITWVYVDLPMNLGYYWGVTTVDYGRGPVVRRDPNAHFIAVRQGHRYTWRSLGEDPNTVSSGELRVDGRNFKQDYIEGPGAGTTFDLTRE
ncbi:MAG: hypothetical protein JNK49_12575 [Planctomycetes bacterium]|nr:hypothetical protein [Planctomycetota bacterium]